MRHDTGMSPDPAAPDMQIRRAGPDDADAVGDVFLTAFRATYTFPLAHSDDNVREWLRGVVADGTSWVAVAPASGDGPAAAGVVGFMRLDGFELDQLYIRPGWWGRGIGSRLIEHAKAQSPDGLTLWTFQVNEQARGFYAHHGFIELLRTDGSGNEERQPDVRLGWRPPLRGSQSWDAVYAGSPPWDIGSPQSAFRALAEAGALRGRVLDVGCGTGEHTLMAAALGLDATGVDIAPTALAIAQRKATERGLTARFLAWDATDLAALGERWQTVLDCGVFHVFDDTDRARYVASLAAAVEPGGRYHMLVFSDRQSGTLGPRRISRAEIRASFADGWSIISIEPAVLETNVGFFGDPDVEAGAPADDQAGPHGAQAWLAVIERVAS